MGTWVKAGIVDGTHRKAHNMDDHIHLHSAHRSRRDRDHKDHMARMGHTGKPPWDRGLEGHKEVPWGVVWSEARTYVVVSWEVVGLQAPTYHQ